MIMKFALVNGKEPTEYFKNTYSFYLLKTYLFAGLKRGILILILLYLNTPNQGRRMEYLIQAQGQHEKKTSL